MTDPLRDALTTALESCADPTTGIVDAYPGQLADALIAAMPTVKAVVDAGVKLHRCWSLRNMQDFDVAVNALLAARKP